MPEFLDRPPAIVSVPNIADSWLPVVGIVADVRNDGLANPIEPAVYVPYTLTMWMGTQILVRAEVSPLTLLPAIRKQIASVDADQQTISDPQDLEHWIMNQREYAQANLVTWLFGIYAVLALALAAVGLYSVVSYSVVQLTNEFGIRVALGAQREHVLRIVFASTVASVGSGIAVGLMLALALNTVVAHWAENSSRDPLMLVGATALLAAVAAVACLIPARRASKVDPMVALRYE